MRRSNVTAVTIHATVEDYGGLNYSDFDWTITLVDGDAAVNASLPSTANATLERLVLPAGSPAGRYNVTLTYRGEYSDSVVLELEGDTVVPVVAVVVSTPAVASADSTSSVGGLAVHLSNAMLRVHSALLPSASGVTAGSGLTLSVLTVRWSLNNVVVGSGTSLALNLSDVAGSVAVIVSMDPAVSLLRNTLRAAAAVMVNDGSRNATTFVNATAEAAFAVIPAPRLVLMASGTRIGVGVVALSETISLTASVRGLPSVPSFMPLDFQFGFLDGGRAASLAGGMVSPNATTRSLTTVAPLVAELASGVRAYVDMAVFVVLRVGGVALASAESSVNVTLPTSRSGAALATSLVQLAGAATDAASVLQLAASMGAFANVSGAWGSDVDAASVAMAAIRMLHTTLLSGSATSALDTTQQGTLFRALGKTMGSVGAASEAEQAQAHAAAAGMVKQHDQ